MNHNILINKGIDQVTGEITEMRRKKNETSLVLTRGHKWIGFSQEKGNKVS